MTLDHRRSNVGRWAIVAAFYALVAGAYGWPVIRGFGTMLPNDLGDPALLTWTIWWNAQAVPLTERWWNAPMFYPISGALALSETLLGLAPLTTPLQWMGLDPVATYDAMFLFSYFAAAMGAHLLAWQITRRHDVALVAGLAYGFSPYRTAQIAHLQVLASWWMPLALASLHRYAERGRRLSLVVFGVCWMLNGLTNGYFLMYFAVLAGLWSLWFLRTRRQWIEVGIAAMAASLPWVPLLAGYTGIQRGMGLERTRGEIESFSADLTAIWATSSHSWVPHHWTVLPRPEGELYPGIAVAALVVVAGILAWRRHGRWAPHVGRGLMAFGVAILLAAALVWLTGGVQFRLLGVPVSVTKPHRLVGAGLWLLAAAVMRDRRWRDGWRRRSAFLFYVAAAAVTIAFAIGPVGHVFGARFMDKAPYFWLMQLPGGDALRVPARFGMLFVLCASQAAALALARFTPAGARAWQVAGIAFVVAADGWAPRLPTAAVPDAYMLSAVERSVPVIELPTRDLYDDTTAMLRAMVHGHPLVNGFSGYYPSHYWPLQAGLVAGDETALQAMRQFGPLLVVVDARRDENRRWVELVERLPGVQAGRPSAVGPVFLLSPQRVPAWQPVQRTPVMPIAAISATENASEIERAIDGRLDTYWESKRAQQPGNRVVLTFDPPQEVTRVEMDFAARAHEYPRRLQVGVAEGDETPREIWSGGLAGPTLLATYEDRRRTTVGVDLPAPVRARHLYLTLTGATVDSMWSMAEVRAIGRSPEN
ncbi:MAG: hypothetical protein IT184_17625 [Acidobacteria bacterium]|nr:hypothetical protein [Acidobacteriota bacterium]